MLNLNSNVDNSNKIKFEFDVISNDFTRAGEASSNIKKILKQLGVDSKIIRRVSIAAYEGEMNIVIHSLGGKIILEVSKNKIILIMKDKGPGIKNLDLAMQEGYSTASNEIRELGFGAGMGLPNIKKCSDVFNIESILGKSTILTVVINQN